MSPATFDAKFQAVKFQTSYDYAKRVTQPNIFTHCIRCFYFAYSLLQTGYPSSTPDAEQIDRGLDEHPDVLNHPMHKTSFEIQGGFLTYEHLQKEYPDIEAERLGHVVQGIILHTIFWAGGRCSSTEALITLSTAFDVMGFDMRGHESLRVDKLWNREMVAEIGKAYPGDSNNDFLHQLNKELIAKPNSVFPRKV